MSRYKLSPQLRAWAHVTRQVAVVRDSNVGYYEITGGDSLGNTLLPQHYSTFRKKRWTSLQYPKPTPTPDLKPLPERLTQGAQPQKPYDDKRTPFRTTGWLHSVVHTPYTTA